MPILLTKNMIYHDIIGVSSGKEALRNGMDNII